jgi:ABC-type amino acid transport substrate-binding protein
MKLKTLSIALLLTFSSLHAQSTYESALKTKEGKLTVAYFENSPMATSQKSGMVGIEVDILKAFQVWIEKNKGIKLSIDYKSFKDFGEMIKVVEKGENNIVGAGSISITEERKAGLKFSAPYLKNNSVFITKGNVATVRSEEEFRKEFNGLRGVAVQGSLHEEYIKELITEYEIDLQVDFLENTDAVIASLKEGEAAFAFLDVLSFWTFMKDSKEFFKIQKFVESEDEFFGYAFPKTSDWDAAFNEFFEIGFGFTSTKDYRKILESHLGYEIIDKVEMD